MSRTNYFIWKAVTIILISGITVFKTYAQDTPQSLALNEAVELTLSNNKSILLAKLDESIAAANYKQTTAAFLPQIGLSYTAMSTNDPLNAFGFKLQQRNVGQSDFNPDLLNHPAGTANFMTKLEVKQPLVNLDMLYLRKGAEKETEIYGYKTQRTKEALTFEVQKAWLQLQLAYDAVHVLEEALKTAQSVYTYTENRFKQGLIQKSDLLNTQVRVTGVRSSLTKAQSNISNASDYLSVLMGRKTGVIYRLNVSVNQEPPLTNSIKKLDSSRPDFMILEKAIEASDLVIKSSKMSYLPKLNALGNYQFNDNRLTGFNANSYLVGVQLSWEIFKGNKTKSTIVAQKLERDKLTEQLTQRKDEGQMELNKAYRDLSDAQGEVTEGKASVEQAAESFRILQNRYQQGLVNTTDVLMAETQLSQQKFELEKAIYSLNLSRYFLQFLTSNSNK